MNNFLKGGHFVGLFMETPQKIHVRLDHWINVRSPLSSFSLQAHAKHTKPVYSDNSCSIHSPFNKIVGREHFPLHPHFPFQVKLQKS